MDPEAFVYMALSSEGECGPGAVVVDSAQGHAKYVPLTQIEPAGLRKRIQEQIEEEPDNLYIISRTDTHMHVFTYSRKRAVHKLQEGSLELKAPDPLAQSSKD